MLKRLTLPALAAARTYDQVYSKRPIATAGATIGAKATRAPSVHEGVSEEIGRFEISSKEFRSC